MAELRRSLVDGLKADTEQTQEAEFVQAAKSSTSAKAMQNAATAASGVTLNTRIHPDISTALKRASLDRKLQGIARNTQRDILEDALTPWLKAHGYLT